MPAYFHAVIAVFGALLSSGDLQTAHTGERTVRVCVRDQQGMAIVNAQIQQLSVPLNGAISDGTGCATLQIAAGTEMKVQVMRQGFSSITQTISEGPEVDVVMLPAQNQEAVEVTAARTPLALDASASSVRMVTAEQLQEAPGFTLDDRLRQVAGFQLFRRTSSWVANPTTQGTTLRGLGSTAASRTLVLIDQVPLNDAYGGWIHWN